MMHKWNGMERSENGSDMRRWNAKEEDKRN